jgi:hypothetical protein
MKCIRDGTLNRNQRLLLIGALIAIGLTLPFLFLQWGNQFEGGRHVFIAYRTGILEWGIYARHFKAGVFFGVIAPLCLFAAAAFISLDLKRKK